MVRDYGGPVFSRQSNGICHQILSCAVSSATTTVMKLPKTVIENANYETLKKAVIEHFESSKPQFHEEQSLGWKPSAFLGEMRATANKLGVNDDLVRHRFQQNLPTVIAPIVASQKTLSMDELGKLADDLMSFRSVSSGVSHINIKNIEAKGTLKKSNVQPFHEGQRPKICRSHIYYGIQARTCRVWCQWPDKKSCKVTESNRGTPNTSRSASPTRIPRQEN